MVLAGFFCYHLPIQEFHFTSPSRGIAVMPGLGRGFCSIQALITMICSIRDHCPKLKANGSQSGVTAVTRRSAIRTRAAPSPPSHLSVLSLNTKAVGPRPHWYDNCLVWETQKQVFDLQWQN